MAIPYYERYHYYQQGANCDTIAYHISIRCKDFKRFSDAYKAVTNKTFPLPVGYELATNNDLPFEPPVVFVTNESPSLESPSLESPSLESPSAQNDTNEKKRVPAAELST